MDAPGMPSPAIVLVLFIPVAVGMAVVLYLFVSDMMGLPRHIARERLLKLAACVLISAVVLCGFYMLRSSPGDRERATWALLSRLGVALAIIGLAWVIWSRRPRG